LIPKSIIGLSDVETVKLDFDETTLPQVKYWALRVMDHFGFEGFIILKSSEESYHVVFDRSVTWEENMKILAWVNLLSQNEAITKYLQMQCIKKCSTLRISHKREKPSPKIVYRFGSQDGEIRNFIEFRRLAKRIVSRVGHLPTP
jgi:hypothetical protein